MASVTNPAKLTSVKSVFSGPNNLKAYNKGGSYVASNNPAPIATSATSLKLSQFNGASASTPLVISLDTTQLSGSSSDRGTHTIGFCNASASGGSGSYTYSIALVSDGSQDGMSITMSWASPRATFKGVNSMNPPMNAKPGIFSTWRITVSDGTSTASHVVSVSWSQPTSGGGGGIPV